MNASPNNRINVLIVGAGPVGLTLACELARRGVDFRIIDKELKASDKSKALGIHSRTLEILESMGMVDKFMAAGHLVYGTNFWHKEKKILHLNLDEIDGPFPYAMMLPQCDTERLLTEQLATFGKYIEWGSTLTTFAQTQNGVRSEIMHADGSNEAIESDYITGCDGAHSCVRHALGLTFEGAQYKSGFATFDGHLSFDKSDDELNLFISENGILACFPMGDGRYRIIADEEVATHNTGDELTLESMQKIVDERGSTGMILSDPVWLTWFTINKRAANNYQVGRAFVLGDAAHIHSPALGQGMNSGMQDSFNLAWKLELVVKGLADRKLLESYENERHPVGKMLLRNTDVATKMITLRNPISSKLRDVLLPLIVDHEVVQHRALKTLSMLGVNYRHSKITGEQRNDFSEATLTKFGAWLGFNHGPQPGDRAPDGYVSSSQDNENTRLFPRIANIKHNILVFAGLKPESDLEASMNKLALFVQSDYAQYADVHFVITNETASEALNKEVEILVDEDQSLHHLYGSSRECFYIIRPDGYVGFRSQSLSPEAITTYFEKISAQLVIKKN
ncbi:MAG: FAD-dependent monooxygenase [Candidatus Obscuribacterales bacterium]|nr:FAD-dependent monooxygenase [Candidatus Obscuribacterales bacterium]